MQLIERGPDIPEGLLQAHEEGRVVFYCGAGISYPARLPGYKGLVDKLYAALKESPNASEKAALKKSQFDTTIGLLEGRIAGNRQVVRERVAKILTPSLAKPTATRTHEALLTLSRSRDGKRRLITTNFDRIFEEVRKRSGVSFLTYEAPLLPIPKARWDGVVYLHGLLHEAPSHSNLDRLVLSSGDFGLAYLTERWAARFVSELFRNYTVCFVGYSINDPVLRYMMDALAADRLLGESPPEAFAFGSYSKGKEGDAAEEWKSKNVTPILYREHNRHAYLHRTLHAWAELYRDGVLGKESIVRRHAPTMPLASTKEDDYVGRMLWALSDKSGLPAKRFAELTPTPSLEWLEPLVERRFRHSDLPRFGVQPDKSEDTTLAYSLAVRPTPYANAPWMAPIQRIHDGACRWDRVMEGIAQWLLKHLDDPRLLVWVAKEGGRLHPVFASFILSELEKPTVSPPMRVAWQLALSERLESHAGRFDLYHWRKRLAQTGLTASLRMELRELLAPRVRIRNRIRMRDEVDSNARERVGDLVDWEIVLSTDYVHSVLDDQAQDPLWQQALPELLSDTTALLRDALDLKRELGGADDEHDSSYVSHPSISEHSQNRNFHEWTGLIRIVRDAWIATLVVSPGRARLEVERWQTIRYPIFRRLAFFALTEPHLFSSQQALDWLLADDCWWLWSVETRRETMRLLATLTPQLTSEQSRALQAAILKGPPRRMLRDDLEPGQFERISDREVWLLLAKMQAAGEVLQGEAEAVLSSIAARYPAWHLADDQSDEFPFWMSEGDRLPTLEPTPKSRRDLVAWLTSHPKRDAWKEDDWRDRCKNDFSRTAAALAYLARRGEWLSERWGEALQAWSEEPRAALSWRHISRVLANIPDAVVKDLAHPLSWWLQSVAKVFQGHEDVFFELVRKLLELYKPEPIEPADDVVFGAINHPVGQATEAILRWWYRQALADNQRLRNEMVPIFTELCDPNIAAFLYARVLLGAHVIALFRVDRPWATQHLLPVFDWKRSVAEAQAVWKGFLWSPRLYRPLLSALKAQFLEVARHYSALGDHGRQYAALLTFASLEPGDTFSRKELADTTRLLPPEGLKSVAETLVRALEGAGEQRIEYWEHRIVPYFNDIWPKSQAMWTPQVAGSFARLCTVASDAFPEAVKLLTHWFKSPADPYFIVHLLAKTNLCSKFPSEALYFLDLVVPENFAGAIGNLADCLNAIRAALPSSEIDERFQRLWGEVRSAGG